MFALVLVHIYCDLYTFIIIIQCFSLLHSSIFHNYRVCGLVYEYIGVFVHRTLEWVGDRWNDDNG